MNDPENISKNKKWSTIFRVNEKAGTKESLWLPGQWAGNSSDHYLVGEKPHETRNKEAGVEPHAPGGCAPGEEPSWSVVPHLVSFASEWPWQVHGRKDLRLQWLGTHWSLREQGWKFPLFRMGSWEHFQPLIWEAESHRAQVGQLCYMVVVCWPKLLPEEPGGCTGFFPVYILCAERMEITVFRGKNGEHSIVSQSLGSSLQHSFHFPNPYL